MIELNRNDYPLLNRPRTRATSNQLSGAAIMMLVLVFITIILMLVAANMGELILIDEPSRTSLPIPMPNR